MNLKNIPLPHNLVHVNIRDVQVTYGEVQIDGENVRVNIRDGQVTIRDWQLNFARGQVNIGDVQVNGNPAAPAAPDSGPRWPPRARNDGCPPNVPSIPLRFPFPAC